MARNKLATVSAASERRRVRRAVDSVLASKLEQKRFVVAFTGLTTTTGGTVTPVTQGVIQGDTGSTRDGNQIFLKELVFRHFLTAVTLAVTQRVIVFIDTMADAATPVVLDVLDTASFITGYNVPNTQERRFKIIHDEMVVASVTGSNFQVDHTWRFKINKKITYQAATNISGANGKNAMFVLFISDGVNGSYAGSFELVFTDM